MPKTDVVVIGLGWTGAIMSKELVDAGLKVVALERGDHRPTSEGATYPALQTNSPMCGVLDYFNV